MQYLPSGSLPASAGLRSHLGIRAGFLSARWRGVENLWPGRKPLHQLAGRMLRGLIAMYACILLKLRDGVSQQLHTSPEIPVLWMSEPTSCFLFSLEKTIACSVWRLKDGAAWSQGESGAGPAALAPGAD